MEGRKGKKFPWIKDVMHSFATSFMDDYNSDVLSTLHRNIENEIKLIYSSNDQRRAEALYKEITYVYDHMRLKINRQPEFQNATLSCVKLISQLIRIGLVLTEGVINSEWIERILTAIKLFPGEKVLVYDAFLLVNGLKKIHQKPYSAILRHIMTEEDHECVTDPLVYMEVILLLRRIKALVLDKFKDKYNDLATKIKPPSNLISWLLSLDENNYSPYLKNLKYKKISQQLMKKALPASFIKKIRYMALNQYNFEVDGSEFKITGTEDQPLDMFIIDNISSTKWDNLDMLGNSQKAVTKKKSQRKRRKLKLIDNTGNDKNPESNIKTKINNICVSESDTDINNDKYIISKEKQISSLSNSKEKIIVSKKKKKSKCNLVKNTKSKLSTILSQDISYSDSFFNEVENSTLLHDIDYNTLLQTNNNTLNEEDLESDRENKISLLCVNESDSDTFRHKQFQNSNKHITVPKKKRKSENNIIKNTKSVASTTLNKNIPDSNLFFHDVESNNISEQLNEISVNNKESETSSKKIIINMYVDKSEAVKTIHKQFPTSNEHIIVSKKTKDSKCELIKTSELEPPVIFSEDVPDTALFFHDVEGSNNSSKKLKTSHNISISDNVPKRDLSEDTDTTVKNASKKKSKKLKSEKCNEVTIPNDSLSNNNILDSTIIFQQQLTSENKDNKQEISCKDDDDVTFLTEVSGNKRKKCESNDDSASDDKSIYLKKLMLKKVNHESTTTSMNISDDQKNKSSAVTVYENSKKKKRKGKKGNKSENVTVNTVPENQSVYFENQTVHLEIYESKIFKDERNSICNVPNAHDNEYNDFCHLKDIDNQSVKKEDNLIFQSENTKLSDEPSAIVPTSQTIEESNQNTVDTLNSELEKGNKYISVHKSDIASNAEYKNAENKCNLTDERETLKPNHIPNDDSRSSIEYPSTKDVSENETQPSQNFNVESSEDNIHETVRDMHSNKCIFTISYSVDASRMAENIANNIQQISDKDTKKHVAATTSEIFIDSNSCDTFDSAKPNKHVNNILIKTNLDSTDIKICLENENQENVSVTSNSKSHHTLLDSMKSKDELLLNKNVNKDIVKFESKSELNESSAENTCSNISFDKSDLRNIDKDSIVVNKLEDNVLYSVDQQKTNVQSNTNSKSNLKKCADVAEDSDNCVGISHIQSQHQQVYFNNEKMEENYEGRENNLKYDFSEHLNIESKLSILDTQIKHKQSKNLSTKSNVCNKDYNKTLPNLGNVGNAEQTHVQKKTEFEAVQKILHPSEEKESDHFEEKSGKKDAQVSDKLHDEKISSSMLLSEGKTVPNLVNVRNAELTRMQGKFEFETLQETSHPSKDKEVGHFEEKSREKNAKALDKLLDETISSNMLFNEDKTVPSLENVEQMHMQEKTEFETLQKTSYPSKEKEINHFEEKTGEKDAQDLDKLHDEKISSSVLVNEAKTVPNLENLGNTEGMHVQGKTEFETLQKTSHLSNEKGIDHFKETSRKKDAQVLDELHNDKISSNMLVNEICVHKNSVEKFPVDNKFKESDQIKTTDCQTDIINNVSNKDILVSNDSSYLDTVSNLINNVQIPKKDNDLHVEVKSDQILDVCENPEKTTIDNSQDDITKDSKNNGREISNVLSSSESICSGSINNLVNNIKTSAKTELPLFVSKNVITYENSDELKINSQENTMIHNKNNEKDLSKENIQCSIKRNNSKNDAKIPVEKIDSAIHSSTVIEKPIDASENDKLKIANSQDGKIIGNENDDKNLSNENISSSKECSDNMNNSAVDLKILDNTIYSPAIIEKSIDTTENSNRLTVKSQHDIINNEKDYSNECILSLKDGSVNVNHTADDVKVSDETMQDISHSLIVTEKPIDASEDFHQLKAVNSQNDNITSNENNEKDLGNESISSEKDSHSINNLSNVAEVCVEIIQNTTHSVNVMEKLINVGENPDQLKAIKSQNNNSENIIPSKECFDNTNSLSNNKVSGKTMESTVVEKPNDEYDNSDQLKAVNSQDNIIGNKRYLSKENIPSSNECFDNTLSSTNDSTISVDAYQNSDLIKAVNSQDNIIGNEKDLSKENIPSSNECFDNTLSSTNDSTISADACQNSDLIKAVNSQDNIVSHENNEKDENITSSNKSSNSICNSANETKIFVETISSTIHSLPKIEKPIDAYENSDPLNTFDLLGDSMKTGENNKKNLSKENILSSNDCFDNVHNSAIDNTTSVDACQNSDQIKAVNSQNDSTAEKDLSNESFSSSSKTVDLNSVTKLVNDGVTSVKEKEDTFQLALDSKNASEINLSNENSSPVENNIELCATKSNFNKREESPEEMSKNKENDGDCNVDFQEQYIVIDESYSDIDDCKSDQSEQSVESSSTLKKTVINKSKCNENLPTNNASSKHLYESTHKQIDQTIKVNTISKISLQKCTNEMNNNVFAVPTNKSEVNDDISSSIDNCKQLHGNYANEIDYTALSGNAAASSESEFMRDISPGKDCQKSLYKKDDHQVEPKLKKVPSEESHENCTSGRDSENSPEYHLSNMKQKLLLIAVDTEHSLENHNPKKHISDMSVLKSQCSSSVLKTEFSKNQEIKFAEFGEQIIQRMKRKSVTECPSEVSESLSVSSFYSDEHCETFTEISCKNKDKNIGVKSVGSVPINNFSSAASTEIFSMYRNELMNDEDNKTDPSISSRDGILSNCEENDEIKSQILSDQSNDECNSKYSSEDEEKESSTADAVEPPEDCNDQSKNTDESLSFKANVPSTADMERNSLDDKNCADLIVSDSLDNRDDKNAIASVHPRQSLRLKTKSESKCETDSTSDISKIQEITKKELKLVLTDCKSSFKNENSSNLCSPVANLCNSSLTCDNNEDIGSSQTSVAKKNSSKTKCKSKEITNDCSKSNKRYSLRHHKSNQSTGDSENLGILLNKLQFDSPSSKRCTRSRRESKFVKELTSGIKLPDNPTDEVPIKRETRSSTAKSDLGIEPNTPNYNLRNRRTIIAPSKLNV